MNKHTVVGAVLAGLLICIGGCGCVTVEPKPEKKPEAPADERSCVTCLEICYPTGDGAMICESECEGGHDCPVHEAKEKAEAIRKLLEPPDSPKPPHQNQDGPATEGGGRTWEL